MAMRHANNFISALDGAINNSQTTINIVDDTGFPDISGGNTCTLTIDDGLGNIESVLVTGKTLLALTVTRGYDGTTASSFPDATEVSNRLVAGQIDDKLSRAYDFIDDDTMASATALTVSSSESIKAYVDTEIAALNYLSNVSEDLTPEFLADLDMNNNEILNALRVRSDILCKASDTTNNITFTTSTITMKPFNADVANFKTNGMQLGAANARVTTIYDTDTLAENSATALATQQSIKSYIDSFEQQRLKAWATYDQSTGLVVLDSYNVTSISDDGVGLSTVTLTTPMSNANYSVTGMCNDNPGGDKPGTVAYREDVVVTTSSFGLIAVRGGGDTRDLERVSFQVAGDQ